MLLKPPPTPALKQNLHINAFDIVNARRVINGPDDKFRGASMIRYPWAPRLWKQMRDNNWDATQIGFSIDKAQFVNMPPEAQESFMRNLAFLSNLDAIQVDNLSGNVINFITDPTIRQCIIRQMFEESIHEEAYSLMIEEMFPDKAIEIYLMYKQVAELEAKNAFIIDTSREVMVDPTTKNKVRAVVSNLALEGIYFFSGFLEFYASARDYGGMPGTVSNIQYIQRDELTHVDLFAHIFATQRAENPEVFQPQDIQEYREILIEAGNREIAWGRTINKGFPSIPDNVVEQRIRYRVDQVCAVAGLPLVYNVANPTPWADSMAHINSGQKNFFETKVTAYSESHLGFSEKKERVRLR